VLARRNAPGVLDNERPSTAENNAAPTRIMKRKLFELSERYAKALRTHLRAGLSASLRPALKLGRQAVTLGLETLELARMHERAFATIGPSRTRHRSLRKAEIFFTEALTPIVETHRAARQSKIDLHCLTETLAARTAELASSNRQLQRGIARRKSVEAALKKSGIHYSKLLKDSLHLQAGLRELTHRVLAAQEDERKKMSIELQNEIAQTLLGINARLLSLKRDGRINTHGLRNELAATQQLVLKSAKSVRRVARKFRSA
jgi:signal transduction histidine kinase